MFASEGQLDCFFLTVPEVFVRYAFGGGCDLRHRQM
jgi:hypothetical protein